MIIAAILNFPVVHKTGAGHCGIRNLEYSEEGKTIYRGEINEECPETPVLDVQKLECLTKEELILIAPKLKELFDAETESTEKV